MPRSGHTAVQPPPPAVPGPPAPHERGYPAPVHPNTKATRHLRHPPNSSGGALRPHLPPRPLRTTLGPSAAPTSAPAAWAAGTRTWSRAGRASRPGTAASCCWWAEARKSITASRWQGEAEVHSAHPHPEQATQGSVNPPHRSARSAGPGPTRASVQGHRVAGCLLPEPVLCELRHAVGAQHQEEGGRSCKEPAPGQGAVEEWPGPSPQGRSAVPPGSTSTSPAALPGRPRGHSWGLPEEGVLQGPHRPKSPSRLAPTAWPACSLAWPLPRSSKPTSVRPSVCLSTYPPPPSFPPPLPAGAGPLVWIRFAQGTWRFCSQGARPRPCRDRGMGQARGSRPPPSSSPCGPPTLAWRPPWAAREVGLPKEGGAGCRESPVLLPSPQGPGRRLTPGGGG